MSQSNRLLSYRLAPGLFAALLGCTVNGKALGPQFSTRSSSTGSPSSSPSPSSSTPSPSGGEHVDRRTQPPEDASSKAWREQAARDRAETDASSAKHDAAVERMLAKRNAERAAKEQANTDNAAARAELDTFCKTVDIAKDASDRENEDRRAWKAVVGCRGFDPFAFWHLEEQSKAPQIWHLAATMRCFADAGGELAEVKPEQLKSATSLTRFAFCAYDGTQLDRGKLEAELAANKNVTPRVKTWALETFTKAKTFFDGHAAAYKALAKESPAYGGVLAAGQAAFDEWTQAFAASKSVFDQIIDVERRGDGSRSALKGCAAKLRPAFFALIAKHKPKSAEDYRAMVTGAYSSRLVAALAFCEEIDGDGVTGALLTADLRVSRGPRMAAAQAALVKIVQERDDNPKFSSTPHLFVPANASPDGSRLTLKSSIYSTAVRGGLVAKVEPKGERVMITFKSTSWMETTYDCKDSNRIGRVDDKGVIHYQQDCKAKGKEKVTWNERAVTIPSAYAVGVKPGQFLLALRKRSEREFYEEGEPLWGALPMFVFTDTNKTKLVSVLGQPL